MGIAESAGMTESGLGSLTGRALLVTTGRIRDSADELRSRDMGFESSEVMEGRRGEFALMFWSGREAGPSNPGMKSPSSSNTESLLVVFARITESVVDAGVPSAESARSRGRVRCGPEGFADFFVTWSIFLGRRAPSPIDGLATAGISAAA
jgi:hypothetical protein